MLNKGVLTFTAGRIRNTARAPTNWCAGVPMEGGLLCLALAASATWNHGEPITAAGREAQGSGALLGYAQGPLPIAASGGLLVSTAGAITGYTAGLPVTATGALAVATAE